MDCGEPDIPENDILQVTESDQSTLYGDKVQFRCRSKYYTLDGNGELTVGLFILLISLHLFPKNIKHFEKYKLFNVNNYITNDKMYDIFNIKSYL